MPTSRAGATNCWSGDPDTAQPRPGTCPSDRFGQVVGEIARAAEPMPMTAYLRDLATSFHAYFTAGNKDEGLRVIQAADPALTQARLTLIAALRQVLANGLGLLGVVPLDRL